jgi:hypothetical protein
MTNDINFHHSKIKNFANSALNAAHGYLRYHYDIDYHVTTYNLFKEEINKIILQSQTQTELLVYYIDYIRNYTELSEEILENIKKF